MTDVGRIEFGPFKDGLSTSQLRMYAIREPVDAAHRIAALERELASARRENATLREALEQIAKCPHITNTMSGHVCPACMAQVALAASPAAEEAWTRPDGRFT